MEWRARLMRLLRGPSSPRLERLDVGTTDPFGNGFERKLELLSLLSRRVHGPLFRDARRNKRRGSGLEFADTREYVPGDDFRFVDTNAAMRFDRLLLRLYEEEEDESLYLLIDASLSMSLNDHSKFNHARRLAAAIAYLGLSQLARVTVVALCEGKNLTHPTSRGKGQFRSIMRFLSGLEPRGRTNLEVALRRFSGEQRRRGVAVLLSDLFDPAGSERGLDVLRYERFQTQVLHITDHHDVLLDAHGDVTIVDAETGHEYPATITQARQAELGAVQRRWIEQAQRHCRAHRLGYTQTDAGDDLEPVVRGLLGRQGRRAT